MKKSMTTTEITRTIVRAPQLARVVDAFFALKADPNDKKAKIALTLLQRERASDCAMCGEPLDLAGYHSTRTGYFLREVLDCTCCFARFIVNEHEVA